MVRKIRVPYAEALVGWIAAGVTLLGRQLDQQLVFALGLLALTACVLAALLTVVLSLGGKKAQNVALVVGVMIAACGVFYGASHYKEPEIFSPVLFTPLGLGLMISAGLTMLSRRK